jgi:hypothetical protein
MGRISNVLALSAILIGTISQTTPAEEITRFDFDANSVGGRNLSYSQSPSQGLFSIAGDGFGIYQVDVTDPLPDQFLDQTTDGSPSDNIGVVNSHPVNGKLDRWFGAVDVFNPNNPEGTASATWEFDISGYTDISVGIDMAAMGRFLDTGFGHPDSYNWTWSVDGAPEVPLFTSSINLDGSVIYTMAGGQEVTWDDPLLMNGTTLSNAFQTITADAPGTGNVGTLTLHAEGDGHLKVYVIDDIVVEGIIPEPASLALLTIGGLLTLRRRRA